VKLENVPAGMTDWSQVPTSEQSGEFGSAVVRTRQVGDVQLRLVECSPGFKTGRWCFKGHVLLVLAGMLRVEHQDGTEYKLSSGTVYHVSDGDCPHRAFSESGARFFIVD
jgi:uncharacterized cupin superfamily protein